MLDANAPGDMVDVPDKVGERRLWNLLPISPQETDVKVDTHQPARLADGVQLGVGQVPG